MRGIRFAKIVAMIAVAAMSSGCGSDDDTATSGVAKTPAPTVSVISLDQGWDDQTRQSFWFTTQGSQIVPYSYFLALEPASNTQPFASAANYSWLSS